MRILHIVPSYKPAYIYGGPIESVSRLCEALVQHGHTVDVFTTTANGKTELDVEPNEILDVDGVKVTYFARITKDPSHISIELWTTLWKSANQYDIIHIHSWWNILVMVAAKIALLRCRQKVIVAPRGMLSSYIFNSGKAILKRSIHAVVGKNLLSKCEFHATADAEYVECKSLIPSWKGFIAPNILLLPDVPFSRETNKDFTLLFMSRIHPKKGLELLFQAISELPFRVTLNIAGSGDELYIEQLKNYALELQINEQICWIGWVNRDEKFGELLKADLLTLTSFNENFANVVIEALHMGTAVLLSENVGLAKFVDRELVGWVCSLHYENIKEKLIDAYNSKNKLEKIRENGRKIIEKNFSQMILMKIYEENYLRISKTDI